MAISIQMPVYVEIFSTRKQTLPSSPVKYSSYNSITTKTAETLAV